ncbi:MAG TPA: DNA polymerase/3'-5' exonuclease PolX [Longimicrobiales bacterium]
MDKRAIAAVLTEIGTLMELRGDNPFRARAFYSAARAVESLDGDVAALARSGELAAVKGIGPATAEVARELVETGASTLHRELREATPDGLLEVLGVPGLGAKRIHVLHRELGIASLDDLERAAREGRIAGLSGFGAKTQEKILEGVAFLRSMAGRRRWPDANGVAAWACEQLRSHGSVVRLEVAGAVRRRLETVDGVDLVAAVEDAAAVLAAFEALPGVSDVERDGASEARGRVADGVSLRLRCVAPDAFAAALAHATGSAEHWAALVAHAAGQGLELTERGLWRGGAPVRLADEVELYAALGLAYVPPELREGRGEVEAVRAGALPRLLAYEDLRGCFHCHTTYSDGRATIREMAEAARARGWRYLGIADHSRSAAYAGGLSADDIRRQHDEIDAWNAEHGASLWLFKGIEADILPDGRLDYEDGDEDVLARFDYVVGSVHSSFGLSEAEQTKRVVRALTNPHLTFLGHPTGRLLLARRGYAIDLDAVIDAAAAHGVGIEINANPWRLDLDWRYWRAAREKGVRTAINPDAHGTDGLDDVRYGVAVARKGWLGVEDVVNAWDLEAVKAYFRARR